MGSEDELVATLQAGIENAQRAGYHFVGTVDHTDTSTKPNTVWLTLEGGDTLISAPHHEGYGGGTIPAPGEVVNLELVGNLLRVTDKLGGL